MTELHNQFNNIFRIFTNFYWFLFEPTINITFVFTINHF